MTYDFKRVQFVEHAGTPRIEINGRRYDGVETDYVTIVVATPEQAEEASKALLDASIQMRSHLRKVRGQRLNDLYAKKASIEREIKQIEDQRIADIEAKSKATKTEPETVQCVPATP